MKDPINVVRAAKSHGISAEELAKKLKVTRRSASRTLQRLHGERKVTREFVYLELRAGQPVGHYIYWAWGEKR